MRISLKTARSKISPVGMADAVELELLDEESRKIKALYRRSHCDDPIILREQLRQADQKRKA